MLWLDAEAVAAVISPAPLAPDAPVEKVSAVELQTRLRGGNLQQPAAHGLVYGRTHVERPWRFVEHPVVVVASREPQLLVWLYGDRKSVV